MSTDPYIEHLKAEIEKLTSENRQLKMGVHRLIVIADAYDANELDDEARKTWGLNDEFRNTNKPEDIILYSGRGGGTLLTLADCIAARDANSPPKPTPSTRPAP
jgi:hypothetical protein